MKKLITYLFIVGGLFLTSCEETESPTYDKGTTDSTQILTYFDQTSATLGVVIDDVGSVTVPIGSSKLEGNNRTVQISVVADATTADASTYNFPSSVVIPANEYFTTLTIDGVDNGVETTPETLTLKLDSVDGGVVSTELLEVSIVQVCPIPDGFFTGMYLIEQTTPEVDGPTLSTGTIVEVVADGTNTSFQTEAYPNFCAGTFFTFGFNLVCNSIIIDSNDSPCRCADGTGFFGAATTPEPYDLADDSVITLTFSDDVNEDCGTTVQTSYTFTKQ